MSCGEPITTVNYPISCLLSNHLFCQKVVEGAIAWKGKSMGNFELGRASSFGKSYLFAWERKNENHMPFLTHAFTFWIYCHDLRATGHFGSGVSHSFTTILVLLESDIVISTKLYLCILCFLRVFVHWKYCDRCIDVLP